MVWKLTRFFGRFLRQLETFAFRYVSPTIREDGSESFRQIKFRIVTRIRFRIVTRMTNAFANDGWFMRTRGVEGGGQVEGLPLHIFEQAGGKTAKCPTEVLIPDRREAELSKLGFLPLLHYKDTDKAVFLGSQSTQKPKVYFANDATANAELSTKLNYMLCVSRFAHYLKAMARDKIGSFAERGDMELWLNNWINNYVVPNPESVGDATKAREKLGWTPKVGFEELVARMYESDLKAEQSNLDAGRR